MSADTFRRLMAVCGVTAAVFAAGAFDAAAEPLYPTPDPDPFYAQPADIAQHAPGDVLEMRSMPPLLEFPTSTVTMVKFRSTNSEGHPIAATTTVLTPMNHVVDGPLLSYQHIINGLGAQCAVSRELYTTDPNLIIREAPLLNGVLTRGWTVALPDHLGPNSAYGAAKLGGMITLDGIRAVQHVAELGVAHSRVAMMGYSGGGMASAWAAALQPTYAPELNIVGSAEGGVPMNMLKMIEAIGFAPHPVFGLAFAAAMGLEREYPDKLPVSAYMNARGLAVRDKIANGCTNDILVAGAGHSVLEFAKNDSLLYSIRTNHSAAALAARKVVDDNSLEMFDGVPTAPIFEWHAPQDALIPVDSIENTIKRYCTAGDKVESELYPSPDHLSTAVLGLPRALDWVQARFNGDPAPTNCAPAQATVLGHRTLLIGHPVHVHRRGTGTR